VRSETFSELFRPAPEIMLVGHCILDHSRSNGDVAAAVLASKLLSTECLPVTSDRYCAINTVRVQTPCSAEQVCWHAGYSSGLAGSRLRLEQQARIVPTSAVGSADPAGDDGLQRDGSGEAECTAAPRNGVVALPKWAAEAPCLAWLWLEAGLYPEPLSDWAPSACWMSM